MNLAFEEIDHSFKGKKWHLIFGKLKSVYIQYPDMRANVIRNTYKGTKWTPWPKGMLILDWETCFICEEKKHKIKFDSDKYYCFEKKSI